MSTFYNVVTRKVIQNGTSEKVLHHRVGIIKITANGGWFLQLFHQPNTEFQIFSGYNNELPVIQVEEDES